MTPLITDSSRSALKASFPALTGFRGLCILWVVFSHVPIEDQSLLESFQKRWGIGVDFFLAISGFLVTRSIQNCDLAAARKGLGAFAAAKDFTQRRVARILPPYLMLLAAVATVALLIDRSILERLGQIAHKLPSFLFFYANYTLPSIRELVPEALAITWSISFQEQFYAFLVLLYLVGRKYLGSLLLAAGVASLVLRLVMVLWVWPGLSGSSHTAQLQMWPHLRFDAISWACLAWICYDRLGWLWATPTRQRWTNLSLFAGLVLVLTAHTTLPGDVPQAVIYCFKGPILALIVRGLCELDGGGLLGSILRSDPLVRVGRVAYEIYLVNALLITAILRTGVSHPLLSGALAVGLSVAFGWLLYTAFSRPAQRFLRGMSPAGSG